MSNCKPCYPGSHPGFKRHEGETQTQGLALWGKKRKENLEILEHKIMEAVVQAWCTPRNENKTFDPDLAEDIIKDVMVRVREVTEL